jgi:hypothetical protein
MTNRTTTTPTSRRRGRVAAIALAATAVAILVAARPADAGTYVTTQCSSIDPGAEARWERTSDDYHQRQRCSSGEGLQVYQDAGATNPGRYGAWIWRAPAGTLFTSLQANASLLNHAGHHGELRARRPDGSEIQFGTEHNDFRVHKATGEFSRLAAMLGCASADGCGRADDDSAHAYVKGVFLRVDDRSTPSIELEGGSLLRDDVVRGSRSVGFSASDRGGGIRRVSVAANDVELAADVRNCALTGGYATSLAPCPTTTAGSWSVATAGPAFDTGPNRVSACASDLALDGTSNRACAERRIWVDNACPASDAVGETLTARFVAGRGVVRSDRAAKVEGRVLDGDGRPLVGATACALTRIAVEGASVVLAATTTTGADGRYRMGLPAGPSRAVFVHQADGSNIIARHGLRLRSRVRPSLAVRPTGEARNGDRVRFTGALPGPACSKRVVKIQARIDGRWQVFRTDRANDRCRFSARYRLRATTGRTTYRFRALVPPQAGYPYERGRSPARSVKAKG